MVEQNRNKQTDNSPAAKQDSQQQFDAAGRSLSEALRISFTILKVIMLVLGVLFLASGFRTVGSDELSLVLRFGKVRGMGEKKILKPGLHWVMPYPIDELVRIPVAKKINLPIDAFWYYQYPSEQLPDGPKPNQYVPPELDPLRDGYCITRSQEQTGYAGQSSGNDYNIVHCKWQLTYKIQDPERFFRNVYVKPVKPGQLYFDIVKTSVAELLEPLIKDAVVTAMVNYSIDEAILSPDRIPNHVRRLIQQKLNDIQSGIECISVQLTDIIWPRQVNQAFLASIRASNESERTIEKAQTKAEKTLNRTAGEWAKELLKTIKQKDPDTQLTQQLWEQAAGESQELISQARAYKTEVVESAKADADYLEQILPEYRKRPRLVLQEIYQDAIKQVLANAEEKFILRPTETSNAEIRILVNRDPQLKRKTPR